MILLILHVVCILTLVVYGTYLKRHSNIKSGKDSPNPERKPECAERGGTTERDGTPEDTEIETLANDGEAANQTMENMEPEGNVDAEDEVEIEETDNQGIEDEEEEGTVPFELSERDRRMYDPEEPQPTITKKPIRFYPPAYMQRYLAAFNVFSSPKYVQKLRKIVDFGCGTLDFIRYMKKIPGIEEILCVDVDGMTLDRCKRKGAPLITEYLNTRVRPLVVEIFHGSVTQNDTRLEKTDAVVCIELIEHLHPVTLAEVPTNIFGYIKPKVAVITTPNADFNVLFPNFTGLRHPDHKFEWTRKEFQDWAERVIRAFPNYEVEFQGICPGPEGTEDLGCCTQMAVFHRLYDTESSNVGSEGLFVTVQRYDYPCRPDNRSDEEKVLHNAEYFIRNLSFNAGIYYDEVSIASVLRMLNNCKISADSLITILTEAGWSIETRETGPVVIVPQPSLPSDESDIDEPVSSTDNYVPPSEPSIMLEEDWNVEGTPNVINPPPPPRPVTYYSRFRISDLVSGVDRDFSNGDFVFNDLNVYSRRNSNYRNREPEVSRSYNPDVNTDGLSERWQVSERYDSYNDTVATTSDSPFMVQSLTRNENQSTVSNTTQEFTPLSVLPDMSVSRDSTSPEPYPLQTVRMDQNDTSNSSMITPWMVDSFESMDNDENKVHREESSYNSNDELENTSYGQHDNSSDEVLNNSGSSYQIDGVQQEDSDNEFVSSSQVELQPNSALAGSSTEPQFTSSPKTCTRISMNKEQRNSNNSSKISQESYDDGCIDISCNLDRESLAEGGNSLCESNVATVRDEKDLDKIDNTLMNINSSATCPTPNCNDNTENAFALADRDNTCDMKVPLAKPLIIKSNHDIQCKTDTESQVQSAHTLRTDRNIEVIGTKEDDTEGVPDVSNIRDENISVPSITVLKDATQSDVNRENQESAPENVETPPKSWSPEVMDSGYPNSASVQDVTPECDLSSIAPDHISDSEPPSVAEAPRIEVAEVVDVVNGDLVNNNRDNQGNNMLAAELDEFEDLQPLIDGLENDLENENDIYALANDFPLWLLRILNMANPIDVEIMPNVAEGRIVGSVNVERDEGFDSSIEENRTGDTESGSEEWVISDDV